MGVIDRVYAETGLRTVLNSHRDVKLLLLQRVVRIFAYGQSTLILALYFESLGISAKRIGLFMTLTLVGDVFISLLLTLVADQLGRRRTLCLGAGLMTLSGIIFAIFGNYWVLLAAAVVGVISPSGNEIGPFRAIEESVIAQLTPEKDRGDVFAWSVILANLAGATGSISSGWIVQRLQSLSGWTDTKAYRVIYMLYAIWGLIKLILSLRLTPSVEMEKKPNYQTIPQDSPSVPMMSAHRNSGSDDDEDSDLEVEAREEDFAAQDSLPASTKPHQQQKNWFLRLLPEISSSSVVLQLCLLFALDSLGSGLTPSSWVTYFFNYKFGISEGALGTLFFCTNLASATFNLISASLARRIGNILTMVFTHLPASILLSILPFPSSLPISITILILRSCLAQMDVAPRTAFLSKVVKPEERTSVMGIVNVVKTMSQSAGPLITGTLVGQGMFWFAFVFAGGSKIVYDLGLLAWFLRSERKGKAAVGNGV